jgi:hypothetical protein
VADCCIFSRHTQTTICRTPNDDGIGIQICDCNLFRSLWVFKWCFVQ